MDRDWTYVSSFALPDGRFFIKENLTDVQGRILRLLASFCGGFAAYFMSGEALMKIDLVLGNAGEESVKATGGFALFLLIFHYFPPPSTPRPEPNKLRILGRKVRAKQQLTESDVSFLQSLPDEIQTDFEDLDIKFDEPKGEDYTCAVNLLAIRLDKLLHKS